MKISQLIIAQRLPLLIATLSLTILLAISAPISASDQSALVKKLHQPNQPVESTATITNQQPGDELIGGRQVASKSAGNAARKRPNSAKPPMNRNTASSKRPTNTTSSRNGTANRQTNSPSSTTNQAPEEDPFALAQMQARLMIGYNNTPPLFVTGTRDFFVDVARFPAGTKITTMKAIDIDGDSLEYSIQPANLNDASPYFSIGASTGDLKLAGKQLRFYPDNFAQHTRQGATGNGSSATKSDAEGANDEAENENMDEVDEDEIAGENQQVAGRNLYFLNVAADDGRFTSVVELQIHAINSSAFAGFAGANLPIQLTSDGTRKGSERIDNLIREKTNEFYNKLFRVPNLTSAAASANTNATSPQVVYPNFVNPGLAAARQTAATPISDQQLASTPSSSLQAQQAANNDEQPQPAGATKFSSDYLSIGTIAPGPVSQNNLDIQSLLLAKAPLAGQTLRADQPDRQLEPLIIRQPMIVSLVIVCSCLMIALVLLMFIIPLSVKRLRKRLKHVELQHEHLSQQTSHGSSIVCSSSAGSMTTNNGHLPSLSQFTLTSNGSCALGATPSGSSSVCRQSSLDSTATTIMSPDHSIFGQPFSVPLTHRVNNGSILNPLYLRQQHQQDHSPPRLLGESTQFMQNHAYLLQSDITQCQPLPASIVANQQASIQFNPIANGCHTENIYHPLDGDEFYSTINTDTTALSNANNYQPQQHAQMHMGLANQTNDLGLHRFEENFLMSSRFQEPEDQMERAAESPYSDSGSSTRSLARFLSLPARHSSHVQRTLSSRPADELEGLSMMDHDHPSLNPPRPSQQVACKTIARTSNIAREQAASQQWELERHKLRFVDILDEGQFGMVWRCKLNLGGAEQQTVAVKTLKNCSAKDGREREELLAEIEIMKSVCHHPNVVKILHCCTTDTSLAGKPILLVMEYMELGKLQSFLEKSRQNHNYATNLCNHARATSDHLTSSDLMKFIYHVAKGMEYLSSQCLVHRDLASRNILVNSERICKIGDFGMARHMQSSSGVYERHSRNTKIPVRWMAPEVLLNNKFTTKSDVYSFGILMWEIVTLGSTPYRHLETEQVIEKVARNGERPNKPEYCHTLLYEIMSRCWQQEPDERPTFRSMVRDLGKLVLSANDYIELDQYPDHDYYNISKIEAPFELL